MPFTRIDGTVSVLGAAPDGDSVRFTPLRADAWTAAHLLVRANAHGSVQLRLDAIDTLETHYAAPGKSGFGMVHQPLALARAGADALLAALGFTHVQRGANESVTSTEPASVPATILTDGVDVHGRCVAFLFADAVSLPEADGARIVATPALVSASVNAAQLASGLAYPTFYTELYSDLRSALASVSSTAREAGLGVWAADATTSGVRVEGIGTLTDEAVLLPKLFRRLVEYLSLGDSDLSGFRAFLDARGDQLIVLPSVEVTGFAAVVAVDGRTVRLTQQPDQLVFFES